MIGLAVFAALLAAFALVLLVGPLLRAPQPPAAFDERSGNLRVLREQLAQLDAEHAAGLLDALQHRRARAEIERRALEEDVDGADPTRGPAAPPRATVWALAVALPLFALVVYLRLGAPEAVRAPVAAAAEHGPSAQEIDAMVARLAERLEANPDDGPGWAMLARSYAALERYPQAAEAYAQAARLLAPDAGLLADYADALAMAQQSLAGDPTRLVERALALDPGHLKALALAGSAALQRQDYAAAKRYWQAALRQVEPGSEQAQALERNIAVAEQGARKAAPAVR